MAKRRKGIIRYFEDIIDDTKDFVDDVLDRARDVEHDVRDTLSRAVHPEDEDDEPTGERPARATLELASARELANLAAALASLTVKIDQLASLVAPLTSLTEKVDELATLQKAAAGRISPGSASSPRPPRPPTAEP